MKIKKKLLCLGAILATCLGFAATATACDFTFPVLRDNPSESSSESSSSEEEELPPEEDNNAEYVYRITLQNQTGFGFSGTTVKLMDGDRLVAEKKTNAAGNANFTAEEVSEVGSYTIVVENAPAGYELPDRELQTSDSAGTQTLVPIKPTGVLEGEAPAGTTYKLGDVMYDFTVTLSDGSEYTLSEVLQENKVVLLNFWATWCNPCKQEFPAMNNAAKAYQDKGVSVVALSTTDSRAKVAEFKNAEGLSFNMGPIGANLANLFNVGSIPHSVMIDRYGVIVFNEIGSMPTTSAFTVRFDQLLGDDYVSTVIGEVASDTPDEGGGEQEMVKPTFSPPAVSDLKEALVDENGSADGFNFRYQEKSEYQPGDEKYDEYNWPWLIGTEENGRSYVYASNQGYNSSYSILYAKMTAKEGDVLTFDYKIGSEEDCDIFYVTLDGVIIKEYSGADYEDWNTSYAYVFKEFEAGDHELAFFFWKDSGTMAHEDIARISNLRLENVSDLASVSESVDIFRFAATDKNEKGAATQFKNYVDIHWSTEDDYAHVGSADGPVLYANMMNSTPWSHQSVWNLAYAGYIVANGINYRDAIEDFAWESTQVTDVYGYTPVTKDLKYLLDLMVKNCAVEEKWKGDYHKDEWLEVCVYWEHYGLADLPEDPMAGITFTAAIEMQEGENSVDVPFRINPRGFKYKFTPTRSGVYKVYSTGDKNPQVFLVDSDRTTMLGYWDDKVFVEMITDEYGNDITDSNFEFYWAFEKDKTYYLLFTTYMDEVASYNVNIDYLGKEYVYRENAALGPYSANMVTFEMFLPDAIEYAYADPAQEYDYADGRLNAQGDGYYHYVEADGRLGSVIMLDVNRPTAFWSSTSLYNICRQAYKYDVEKRALYIDGVDYTDEFKRICFIANKQSGDMKGFAKVDKNLFDLLQKVTMSAKYEGIEESWLLLCYYDKTLIAKVDE